MRAAAQFVCLTQQFQSSVRVFCDGRAADGRSVLDLLMLAAGCGTRLELDASGLDAEEAIAALCALIEARFHEAGDQPHGLPDC
jgi:phosphotransferase system HPr (HPr) family protein